MDKIATTPGTGLIYMKIGTHAQESLEDILERKKRELYDAGMSFWGYGGPTCHPLSAVQPFVKERLADGHAIFLAMKQMDSHHFAEPKLAEKYSDDGVNWKNIPKGVIVKGSRYALILDSLEETEFPLDLSSLRVGIGTSRGKNGSNYVKGQVDKGCFVVEGESGEGFEPRVEPISVVATLKAPYAVLLK